MAILLNLVTSVFPVLECISYSCAIKRSWLSLWLGLEVDIFQFWNVYRTVRKKDLFHARVRVSSQYVFSTYGLYIIQLREKEVVGLAVVRVISGYFPVLQCISYSFARTISCFSLGLWLAVSIFQFWIVYYTVAQERDLGSRCG